MNPGRQRPLSVGPLRAFEAVARRLSFRAAAEELYLTQSAVSRQIRALEDEIGASLFSRGTRHVELTAEGALLLRAVLPALERLDSAVHSVRQGRGRKVVSVSTFASFSSLWLIPRLSEFQRVRGDIDIRVSANDRLVDPADGDIDLLLRYGPPAVAPAGAQRLFGEVLTPVMGRWLADQVARGVAPPLSQPADLAQHLLAEEEDERPSSTPLHWRHWLHQHGLPGLQPQRWLVFNFTHQQVQAAASGQAIALGRLPMVADMLARGELVEPFGTAGRQDSENSYWLLFSDAGRERPEVIEFAHWVLAQAALTREAMGAPA
ncbi:MAG: hypothetical protein RJA98_3195 [Pseudomonadota bacterium]